jgi:hypothetical protein
MPKMSCRRCHAEDVIQGARIGVLALKPENLVSPVTVN